MIWGAVAIGLIVTIFGASSSAALITTSRAALAEAVSRRLKGAAESLDWLHDAERDVAAATATTGLGIALLAAALSAVVDGVTGNLPLWGVLVLLVLVAVPFMLFSGYVLPRWLTAHRASRVAERVQPILTPWSKLLASLLPARLRRPVADVRSLWRESPAGGDAQSEELVMVGSVITFAQRPIREVMTARTELVAIPEGAATDEIRAAFIQSGYSRLPVYRGTLDEIIGMVHVLDLLTVGSHDRVSLRPVGVAPGSRTSGDVLLDMQTARRHLTVVLDEFGGTLGIVTLEDLLEAMVGEIFEEATDTAEQRVVGAAAAIWETDGDGDVEALEQRFGVQLPAGSARSIGGRIAELLGRFPLEGERLVVAGLEVDVIGAAQGKQGRLIIRRRVSEPVSLDRETR